MTRGQKDIRWKQLFANYKKALRQLEEILKIEKILNPELIEHISRVGVVFYRK